MRAQQEKLKRRNSTKQERRIGEILKRNRVRFVAKAKVGDREVDFLIGRVALEIDGRTHDQTDVAKDTMLYAKGYVPLHITTEGKAINLLERELITIIESNNYVRRRKRST